MPLDEDISSAKALGTLQAFSLITKASKKEQEDQLFDIHRLARLATQNWLATNYELKSWARKAIASMSKRFPAGSHENRDICRAYLPHALAVLSSEHKLNDSALAEAVEPSQKLLMETKTAQATLQLNVSWYFQTSGDFTSVEPIARPSLTLRETVLGKEHPDTLTSKNNVASVLRSQGKYKEAEEMNRRTLKLRKTVLGKNHLETLISMSNLAEVLEDRGKYEEAEQINRQTLKLREIILNKEHLKIIISISNLVSVLEDRDKYEEAESISTETKRESVE